MLFSSPTLMVVTVGLQFVAVGVCNRVKNLYIKESTLLLTAPELVYFDIQSCFLLGDGNVSASNLLLAV